jgi:RNA recognition motif-containing protein
MLYFLKEFFGKFGKVLDVRILTKWNGASKGIAYVDFATNEDAAAALVGADGAEIRGKPLKIIIKIFYFSLIN